MSESKEAELSLVLMGGSSGSFLLFEEILTMVTKPLPCSLIFILHRGKDSQSELPNLFRSRTDVRMEEPQHLDLIENNCIYFAVPDYHLLIGPDRRFYLDGTEKDFFSRPSIDATFISAAQSGIAIKAAMIFSGASEDGAKGLRKVAEKGFDTYVQNPESAEVQRMPAAAIREYNRHAILSKSGVFEEIRSVLYSYST